MPIFSDAFYLLAQPSPLSEYVDLWQCFLPNGSDFTTEQVYQSLVMLFT